MVFGEEEEGIRGLKEALAFAETGKLEKAISAIERLEIGGEGGFLVETALELCKEVRDELEEITNDEEGFNAAIVGLIDAYLEYKDFEKAKELRRHIHDEVFMSMALAETANALVEAGRFDDALETINELGIENVNSQYPLSALAIALSKGGKPKQALELARRVTIPGFKVTALEQVILGLLDQGLVDCMNEAIDLIHKEREELSLNTYSDLAVLFARRGDLSESLRYLKKLADAEVHEWPKDLIALELLKHAVLRVLETGKRLKKRERRPKRRKSDRRRQRRKEIEEIVDYFYRRNQIFLVPPE